MNRRIALPLLAAALVLTGCVEDEDLILPQQTPAQQLFRRYVAMGNSITAGFMSGGINDSTQRRAYPVLLAARANVGFGIPSLALPGCPPPLLGVLDTTGTGEVVLETDRVGGGTSGTCALRQLPIPEFVQNVAVPGAKIADAFDITREGNATNALTTLLLGGLTQIEAMRRAQPTLVTAWLGNNDVLGAALVGDPSLMTPVDTFAFYAERLAAGIGGTGPVGVVLLSVVNPTVAPALQPGLYFWAADSMGFSPKPVSADCAPTDAEGTRNPLSMNTVSFIAYRDASVTEISCDPAAPYVLTAEERDSIDARVAAFNNILLSHAQQRQWIFINVNTVLNAQLLDPSIGRNRVRQCRTLDNSDSPEAIGVIVESQCPHESAPNFFGSFITFDGVHPSAEAHQVVANAILQQLNLRFDLGL